MVECFLGIGFPCLELLRNRIESLVLVPSYFRKHFTNLKGWKRMFLFILFFILKATHAIAMISQHGLFTFLHLGNYAIYLIYLFHSLHFHFY